MVLSDVSIKRPVFATVLSLLLVVLGLAAFLRLQIREYPDIDPPIVSISTTYTGASAEVVENQVTEPLESAVAGIEAIKTISSVSRDERSEITIEFQLGRDIESAANDVRDKVARALDDLPDSVKTPIIAKVDADARAIIWVAVVSERRSALELTDFIDRQLKDRFSLIEGVASVIISGERRFAMRVWLSREEMAARGITVPDIEGALRKQNVELRVAAGSRSRELTVRTTSACRCRRPSPRSLQDRRLRLPCGWARSPALMRRRGRARPAGSTAAPPSASASSASPRATPSPSPRRQGRGGAAGHNIPRRHQPRHRLRRIGLHRPVDPRGLPALTVAVGLPSSSSSFRAPGAPRSSRRSPFRCRWSPIIVRRWLRSTLRLLALVLTIGLVVDDARRAGEHHAASTRASRRCSPPIAAPARSLLR
jgi:hypothetical protein